MAPKKEKKLSRDVMKTEAQGQLTVIRSVRKARALFVVHSEHGMTSCDDGNISLKPHNRIVAVVKKKVRDVGIYVYKREKGARL